MKNKIKNFYFAFAILAAASLSFYSCAPAASDDTKAEEPVSTRGYYITENDAANIAITTDYLNSLVTGDGGVAKSLVGDGFMSFGPAAGDSATIEQVVQQWATNASNRTNQQAGIFISNGLTVTEGPLAGDWVSMWGTYTCNDTKSGLDISVPWHSVSKIENGKITQTRAWFDNLAPSMAIGTVVAAK